MWLGCRGGSGGQLSSTLGVTLAGSLALSGFDSVGQYLYLRKVSDMKLICSVGSNFTGKKLTHVNLLSLSSQFHLEISPHLVLKQADKGFSKQSREESQRNFLEVKKIFLKLYNERERKYLTILTSTDQDMFQENS